MRKKIIVFSFIMVFMNSVAAISQETESRKVVLSELIQTALSENPQIKAAEEEWQASLEKIPQVKSLPDPMLSYAHFGQSVETRLGPKGTKSLSPRYFHFSGSSLLKVM